MVGILLRELEFCWFAISRKFDSLYGLFWIFVNLLCFTVAMVGEWNFYYLDDRQLGLVFR